MSSIVTVPLSEYLDGAYRPDREYIDGELLERNVGELDHSRFQMLLSRYLSKSGKAMGIIGVLRTTNPDITVPIQELENL